MLAYQDQLRYSSMYSISAQDGRDVSAPGYVIFTVWEMVPCANCMGRY
jgi:hypothetical protein